MADIDLTPDQQRVRGYLITLSERSTWIELWPRVLSARIELLTILDRVSDEQARFSPGPDEWSTLQSAEHALEVARSVLTTVEELAGASERTVQPDTTAGGQTLAEIRTALIENSVALASLPQRVPEPPSLEPVAPHAFFGDLHCKAWFLFQRIHDTDHIQQIAALQADAGYPQAD